MAEVYQAIVVTPDGVAHSSVQCEHVGHDRVEDLTMYANLVEARNRVGERFRTCQCLECVDTGTDGGTWAIGNPDADGSNRGHGFPSCNQCGETVPYDAKSCPNCGKGQPVTFSKLCEKCGQAVPQGTDLCPHCGHINSDD